MLAESQILLNRVTLGSHLGFSIPFNWRIRVAVGVGEWSWTETTNAHRVVTDDKLP